MIKGKDAMQDKSNPFRLGVAMLLAGILEQLNVLHHPSKARRPNHEH